MRLTQRTALDLFIAEGFDAVTVGQIAESVGMAASTLYRHFETKEAIVLWDEHDADVEQALLRESKSHPPFEAMQRAFAGQLSDRYRDDLDFQLKRVKYIYATEQVHAAAVEADLRETAELTEWLASILPKKQRAAAPLLAGAAMLAIDIALDRWQQSDGRASLSDLITEAFDTLGQLRSFG